MLYAFGEIILVMFGILLAFQVDNWNESRVLAKKEVVYLKEIRKNLESDLKSQLIPGAEYYQLSLDSYDALRSNSYKWQQDDSEHSVRRLFLNTVLPWKLVFNTVAFEKMNSMGIDLISDDSIRENISQLYGYEYRIILDYHNVTVTEFREDFVPLLNDNINLHRTLSESELDYLKLDTGINARLRGMVYRRQALRYYFLNVKPKVEKLIADIDAEIKRMAD